MRLTHYTDFSLRVLTYLGLRPERLCTISEIAEAYGISRNHLMKVVHELGRAGFIDTVRGRNGGLRLARMPSAIRIGDVVRRMEDDFDIVACFGAGTGGCVIAPDCRLAGMLGEALQAFLGVLDGYTLADLIVAPDRLLRHFPDMADTGMGGTDMASRDMAGKEAGAGR